jgi:hypothetical protein
MAFASTQGNNEIFCWHEGLGEEFFLVCLSEYKNSKWSSGTMEPFQKKSLKFTKLKHKHFKKFEKIL